MLWLCQHKGSNFIRFYQFCRQFDFRLKFWEQWLEETSSTALLMLTVSLQELHVCSVTSGGNTERLFLVNGIFTSMQMCANVSDIKTSSPSPSPNVDCLFTRNFELHVYTVSLAAKTLNTYFWRTNTTFTSKMHKCVRVENKYTASFLFTRNTKP